MRFTDTELPEFALTAGLQTMHKESTSLASHYERKTFYYHTIP